MRTFTFFAIFFWALIPSAAPAADVGQIAQIATVEIGPAPSSSPANITQSINASTEDAILSFFGNRPGCAIGALPLTDPKWDTLRDHIYADYAENYSGLHENPTSITYRAMIASLATTLQQSDANALIAFYGSPQGQRYQQFLDSYDALATDLVRIYNTPFSAPYKTLSPEQADAYRVVVLSRLSRTIALHSAPIGHMTDKMRDEYMHNPQKLGPQTQDELRLMFAFKNVDRLEALYRDYRSDIPAFEAFQASAAWKNFVSTYRAALLEPKENSGTRFTSFNTEFRQKWTAFCSSLVGTP